jgi:nucleoside-diphosphate-sugar epimerase
MAIGEPEMTEDEAYPALPDNDYGWEKLYSERAVTAYGERYGIATRIARFQNTYGPEGTWQGGREKAPAAICRKVAEAPDGGEIEVWGDGTAVRSYTYVDDLIDGILLLMASDRALPTNIGNPEYVSVNELVETVAAVAGKTVAVRHVDGPVGVQSRNFANGVIEGLGFQARYPLRRGIEATYPWVAEQVRAAATA